MMSDKKSTKIEMWGGVECTVNRVGDKYFDQLSKTGHLARPEDFELFAGLGIKKLRFPILWEQVVPAGTEKPNWAPIDAGLERLEKLRIRPIAGLLHHGSGPSETGLTDPLFPEKFADFALQVAGRYPHISEYTPINEPLTTARFSGLYGLWHPHGRDDRTFVRALLNQCRAIVLAMRTIRGVNPKARLIQTEDLGKTYSTPRLRAQAKFENQRRWLSSDLLCGRVTNGHPLWKYLVTSGADRAELEWFARNPCPPDVLGFNYYATSERFLDENTEIYPARLIGGNGRYRYADVEAVRVDMKIPSGLPVLLREAWERYKLPLAVTEAHLGCTREEQMRWFLEIWETARALENDGVDVRAVTAWALLGSFDWNSLLTVSANHYEPGVFDIRGGAPRPTALAGLIKNLAAGRKPEHPVLQNPGWWKRSSRFFAQPAAEKRCDKASGAGARNASKPLLITGATGTLGQAFARICRIRNLDFRLLSRREMDISDIESVQRAVRAYEPWAVINTAGYVRVDEAESEPDRCALANTAGAVNLAMICAGNGIPYLTFSTDLVFDGKKKRPYLESDAPNPLNVYGQSKREAEKLIAEINPDALIVRTAAFFGPWDEHNFLHAALRTILAGSEFRAAADNVVSPTYVPDLVNACLDILLDGESGLWHMTNQGEISWADFARRAAKAANLDTARIVGCSEKELGLPAPRPAYSVLSSERGIILPDLESSLANFTKSFKQNY